MKKFTLPICILIAGCICACTAQPQTQIQYAERNNISLLVNLDRNDLLATTEQPEFPTELPTAPQITVPTESLPEPAETKHLHTYDIIAESEPSCSELGLTKYQCPCGEGYSVEIPMLAHSYEAEQSITSTCTEQGYTVYTCSGCGNSYESDFTEAPGHSYIAKIIIPTLEAQGYTEYTCTVCGFSYQDDFVEKLTVKEETVYATCTVNVRSGPGTDHAILDTLYFGESIQKLADFNSEWSLVQYGNIHAYMYSAFINTTKPEPIPAYPYVGTLSIPSVGVEVKCYDSSSQAVVDAYNSAGFFRHQGHDVIADHVNQGFYRIKSCVPGTTAYLHSANGTREYICVDNIQGHNTGSLLTDENYNKITYLYPESLVCYTCNDNWQNITLVFFEEVSAPKEEGRQDPMEAGSCSHSWNDWEIAWETVNDEGTHYGWRKRICTICDEEEWKAL